VDPGLKAANSQNEHDKSALLVRTRQGTAAIARALAQPEPKKSPVVTVDTRPDRGKVFTHSRSSGRTTASRHSRIPGRRRSRRPRHFSRVLRSTEGTLGRTGLDRLDIVYLKRSGRPLATGGRGGHAHARGVACRGMKYDYRTPRRLWSTTLLGRSEVCEAHGPLCPPPFAFPRRHRSIIKVTLGMRTPEQVERTWNSVISKSRTAFGAIFALRG
jgi:hypothetical protein